VHSQQSILLIIDNAELIPQQTLSSLWQSIHELDRMNQTLFTFNVLLIGDTRWAVPIHHGLKNKVDSLVAEFGIDPLTPAQATDFMMSVHTDWSDQKIQQFINKISPEYLVPKQLVYAQLPVAKGIKRKVLLFVSVIVLSLCIVTVIVVY
jgi:mRNA degradation ribonuclease J1/J2